MADHNRKRTDSIKDILCQTPLRPETTNKGGGVDGGGLSSTAESAPSANATDSPASTTTNGPHNAATPHKSTPTNSSQKDFDRGLRGHSAGGKPPLPPSRTTCFSSFSFDVPVFIHDLQDPEEALAVRYQESLNEQFFGAEQSSGLSYKDREDRVRQLRERQQIERQQKLEELKEQAASAQRFREQQETARRQRLDEMRCKDFERRTQVEERKKLIQQAEQQRREAVLRKSAEREQRLDHKRRQERSNAVFAFGSSTPRMLDPKESQNYWGARRATSTTNVNMSDSTTSIRRTSECQDSDLSRKRATSAHSLNRKPEDVRMSTSMYEVFNWDNADVPASPKSHAPGTRLTKSRDSSLERRKRPSSLKSCDKSESRFSVWEFGDNFSALGPSGGPPVPPCPSEGQQQPGGISLSASPSSKFPPSISHFATAPTTPTSSRRTASVLTGAGCTVVGEEPSLPRAALVTTAARRRTDLMPSVPSIRDVNHRSPGRALSLDQLASKGRNSRTNTPTLAPLHESPRTKRISSMSKSMSHLGPQKARNLIGPTTDGAGVPVVQGSLDRRSSRSSLALAQPRMTRSEILRLKLREAGRNANGMRSGTNTPSSRPNSALSHASGSSQVMLRNKASPKKPRPLSIAGSVPSAADKPRHAVTVSPSRESRSIERKTSVGGTAPGAAKGSRAKSVGSDRSAPSTPSKSSRGTTPKRTPAQVKAESAARKASKAKSTPKAPLVNSLSLESKTEKKSKTSTQTGKVSSKPSSKESSSTDLKVSSSTPLVQKPEEEQSVPEVMKVELDTETIKNNSQEVVLESNVTLKTVDPETEDVLKVIVNDPIEAEEVSKVEQIKETPKIEVNVDLQQDNVSVEDKVLDVKTTVQIPSSEQEVVVVPESTTGENEEEKSRLQKAAEKPVTGYATEEQYKAALAEKRRQAREAKERELELEKQRQLEEEERERKEEEEYLKLIEDQKKAEEIRLQKAIQEAEKQRQEDKIKAEEEEKLRIETEKVELQKKLEQEERMKREEEERQLRKSRVAAIMSRTRGKGSSTPTKTESKTPSDETKGVMSESFISNISSSMTDSMIVQAIESREENKKSDDAVSLSSQATSDLSSQPLSGFSSQPPSDVSSNAANTLEMSSQPSSGIHSDCGSTVSQDTEKDEAEKCHRNGNSPIDTTPTIDLLGGSINGVNGVNHNGVQLSDQPDNLLGSFDPLNSTETTSSSKSESTTFDQIIDLNQSKLTNEDAVNSNSAPPHPPIIAFEDNLNKKSNQDTSSNVPDLLL